MLKKTITYKDFNGVEKTETHYFTLTESELTRMTMSEYGAMDERLKEIVSKRDTALIMDEFYDLMKLSYGVKTPDGRFIKKKDGRLLFEDFETTGAFDALFMELCTNGASAAEFARSIIPDKLRAEAEAKMREMEKERDSANPDSAGLKVLTDA